MITADHDCHSAVSDKGWCCLSANESNNCTLPVLANGDKTDQTISVDYNIHVLVADQRYRE